MKRKAHTRNRGSVAILAFVGVIPLVAAIGGFAVDCMHVNDAKGALQRATDAAALAGAEDLQNYVFGKNMSASSVSITNAEPVNYALQLAALNAVDGPIGLWSSSKRSITATILHDPNLALTQLPGNAPNRCNVQSSIFITSLFAKLFGNFGQTVSTFSAAGIQPAAQFNGPAAIKVSWDTPGPNGEAPLSTFSIGQTFTLEIKNNAGWIYNAEPVDQDILYFLADPAKYPLSSGDISKIQANPIYIGESLPDAGVKQPAVNAGPLLQQNQSIIPFVIMDIPFNGTVGGFEGLKVTKYTPASGSQKASFTGRLVLIQGAGLTAGGGQQVPGVPTVSVVRLIQ